MESQAFIYVLAGAFALAFAVGAVGSVTNFCTLGAVSDWVNMGDTRRLRAWLLAMAVAILGVALLEGLNQVAVAESRIPYRASAFAWLRYPLGGLLFGIGMALASGCASKNLFRIGAGSLKALATIAVAAVMAYLMIRTAFYGRFFHPWVAAATVELQAFGLPDQGLGSLLGGLLGLEAPERLNPWLGLVLSGALLAFVFRSAAFRGDRATVIGGATVGLAVVGAWYLTGGPIGREWIEDAHFMPVIPPAVGVQSLSFVSPLSETYDWLTSGLDPGRLSFGVAVFAGVVAGALAQALIRRRFRWEWFRSWGDFARNMAGGVLLGLGGVLALGCSIGQGVTGVSTLALGSFIAAGAMMLGAALTMKAELYHMVYEDRAGWPAAIVAALADLRLLPARLRRLDPV